MNVLAVDTSGKTAACAILKDKVLVSEYVLSNEKTHSEKLMPIIENLIFNSGMDIEDIDLFAAANGPGSFTGLRIGVSCIKGLAQALNKPVAGVSSLEGLAYGLCGVKSLIAPILDARRSEVYTAIYKWDNGKLLEIKPPRALAFSELVLELEMEEAVFVGDMDLINKLTAGWDKKEMGGGFGRFIDRNFYFFAQTIRASNIAALALQKKHMAYDKLSIEYIRKSQAERNIN